MPSAGRYMMRKLGLQTLRLTLALSLFVSAASAQTSTVGSISGTVRDQQGAAVPGAEVTITDRATSASRTVTANDDGSYVAPSLPVGSYVLSTSPQGFKKTITVVDLHVGDKLVVDFKLEVGSVNETVTITGAAQLVETRTSDVSSLIAEKQVTELPLNGRNYAQLVTLVPGVSPVAQAGAGGAFSTRGTGLDSHVDMSVNGNQSNANLWTVDGVNNMD